MTQGWTRANWIHSIRTFILRFVEKTTKRNDLSPSFSLSPPRFSAHDTRGKRREDLFDPRILPVHDTSRWQFFPQKKPPVSGSQWEEAARGFWVDERGYAARWGRLVTDSLSPGVATPTPPLRHPSASLSPFSTERDPLDTPTPARMPLLSCSAGIACALYPRLPTNSLSLPSSLCTSPSPCLSLATDVHLSGVEHKVADRLSPTLPPDAIRYIPWRIVREGGGWWNSGWMGALGKMRTGDI